MHLALPLAGFARRPRRPGLSRTAEGKYLDIKLSAASLLGSYLDVKLTSGRTGYLGRLCRSARICATTVRKAAWFSAPVL